MQREELIDLILNARTEREIEEARELASEYLKQDPADDGVRMCLEQLKMLELAQAACTKVTRLLLRLRR